MKDSRNLVFFLVLPFYRFANNIFGRAEQPPGKVCCQYNGFFIPEHLVLISLQEFIGEKSEKVGACIKAFCLDVIVINR